MFIFYKWTIFHIATGWWFGTFFIFPYIGNDHPNWLIFFKWVETTNQIYIYVCFFIWFIGVDMVFSNVFYMVSSSVLLIWIWILLGSTCTILEGVLGFSPRFGWNHHHSWPTARVVARFARSASKANDLCWPVPARNLTCTLW